MKWVKTTIVLLTSAFVAAGLTFLVLSQFNDYLEIAMRPNLIQFQTWHYAPFQGESFSAPISVIYPSSLKATIAKICHFDLSQTLTPLSVSIYWLGFLLLLVYSGYFREAITNSMKKFIFWECRKWLRSKWEIFNQAHYFHGIISGLYFGIMLYLIINWKETLHIFNFFLLGIIMRYPMAYALYLLSNLMPNITPDTLKSELEENVTDEDFIGRLSWEDRIIQNIKDPDINTIGLYGMNGIGKSSLIKRTKIKLNERNNPIVLMAKFEPAHQTSEKEIIELFYKTMMSPLTDSGHFRGISEIPNALYEIAAETPFINKYFPIFYFKRFISKPHSKRPEDIIKPLINILTELELTLVTVIDDLDRCPPKTRVLIFQLLNTLKLDNNVTKGKLKFIVCASAEELFTNNSDDGEKHCMFTKSERHLERFIDINIQLPPLSIVEWESLFDRWVQPILDQFSLNNKSINDTRRFFEITPIFQEALNTPRLLKRFARHLDDAVNDKNYLPEYRFNRIDMLVITAIQTISPQLYEFIGSHINFLTDEDSESERYNTLKMLGRYYTNGIFSAHSIQLFGLIHNFKTSISSLEGRKKSENESTKLDQDSKTKALKDELIQTHFLGSRDKSLKNWKFFWLYFNRPTAEDASIFSNEFVERVQGYLSKLNFAELASFLNEKKESIKSRNILRELDYIFTEILFTSIKEISDITHHINFILEGTHYFKEIFSKNHEKIIEKTKSFNQDPEFKDKLISFIIRDELIDVIRIPLMEWLCYGENNQVFDESEKTRIKKTFSNYFTSKYTISNEGFKNLINSDSHIWLDILFAWKHCITDENTSVIVYEFIRSLLENHPMYLIDLLNPIYEDNLFKLPTNVVVDEITPTGEHVEVKTTPTEIYLSKSKSEKLKIFSPEQWAILCRQEQHNKLMPLSYGQNKFDYWQQFFRYCTENYDQNWKKISDNINPLN